MADESNGNGGLRMRVVTAVLSLLLTVGGIVSWVQSTFVSQQELAAIREVVERAERTLSGRIDTNEQASLRRTQTLDSRIDSVVTILDDGQTELLKALMEHQRDHINSGGCPSPTQ